MRNYIDANPIFAIMNMNLTKKIIFIYLLISASALSVYAQNTIILRNGNELKGKVTTITLTEVNYIKAENLDGAVNAIPKKMCTQ